MRRSRRRHRRIHQERTARGDWRTGTGRLPIYPTPETLYDGSQCLRQIVPQIVTLRGVVSEIRDRATRQRLQDRLQMLPYDIHFKEPNAEDLYHGELLIIS